MNVILDKNGNVIQRSKNLAGIRRYVSNHLIKVLDVTKLEPSTAGKLCILFDDGSSYETNFCSYCVLCNFVLRWRNVYGAPLTIGGESAGKVSSKNAKLIEQGN